MTEKAFNKIAAGLQEAARGEGVSRHASDPLSLIREDEKMPDTSEWFEFQEPGEDGEMVTTALFKSQDDAEDWGNACKKPFCLVKLHNGYVMGFQKAGENAPAGGEPVGKIERNISIWGDPIPLGEIGPEAF